MSKEKDVLRHEKLQVLYWLKTQTVCDTTECQPEFDNKGGSLPAFET
jgi:hypothetical protein